MPLISKRARLQKAMLRACSGFFAGDRKDGFFSRFVRFFMRIAVTMKMKKGEKRVKKPLFRPGKKIPNTL